MKEKEKIYPKELVLNLENTTDTKATFLDIEAEVVNRVFRTKTYDKRDAFGFDIVNYPDLSGNIPHRQAYGVFISQIIRYARICSNKEDLSEKINLLIKKLINRGFDTNQLKNTYKRCVNQRKWIRIKMSSVTPTIFM